MKVMNRTALIPLLFVAFATSAPGVALAQALDPNVLRSSGTTVRVDTIVNVDTVIRTEIITRTDILSRQEIIVRKDSLAGSSSGVFPAERRSAVPPYAPVATSPVAPMPVVQKQPQTAVTQVSPVTVAPTDITVVDVDNGSLNTECPDYEAQIALIEEERAALGRERENLEAERAAFAASRAAWEREKSSIPVTLAGDEKFPAHVTFRGDTIPTILRTRNFGRYDRGLFNHLFIPKGIWQIGVTASYGEFSTENLEMLDLVSDVDFSGHIFAIRPYFSYFINNNMSVGMRLGYNSGKASINSFAVDIDEDMSFNLHDISYDSESYTAAVTYNQYFGIAPRGRFGIFNEVELAFSGGSSDFRRPYNGVIRETHTTTMQAALNFSPGVCVFIMDQVSFNVSFGVFGFSLRNEKQTVDGTPAGSRFTSGANFRFNIFNINFGVAVNL